MDQRKNLAGRSAKYTEKKRWCLMQKTKATTGGAANIVALRPSEGEAQKPQLSAGSGLTV